MFMTNRAQKMIHSTCLHTEIWQSSCYVSYICWICFTCPSDHTAAAIINKLTAASPLSRRTQSQPKSARLHLLQYSNMNLVRVKFPARRYHGNSSFVITALWHLEFANLTWVTETFSFLCSFLRHLTQFVPQFPGWFLTIKQLACVNYVTSKQEALFWVRGRNQSHKNDARQRETETFSSPRMVRKVLARKGPKQLPLCVSC